MILWVSCKASGKRHLATFSLRLIILVIGCSRIYLGVHYLSDILAGYSLRLSWLILSYGLFGPNPSSQTQLP
ncbi:phosphatase PAP2 family protein [Globicatella sulfidifaciens]|uniref:phosphatase PAP2 family protein n=1 Tax=Globicatella sulfidifaciens TaxID=136093 RepID=UPI0013563C05